MYLIYKLTNPHNGLSYVGLTKKLERRLYIHGLNNTVEYQDFTHEVLFDNIPSRAEANEMEKVFIDVHDTFDNGYNQTRGGGTSSELAEEVKQKISETHLQRVKDGIHPWLDSEIQRINGQKGSRPRVKQGTHHWQDFDKQSKEQRRRVAEGTHHFLDKKAASERQKKKLEEGDHNFLGDTHPMRNHKSCLKRWETIQRNKGQLIMDIPYQEKKDTDKN